MKHNFYNVEAHLERIYFNFRFTTKSDTYNFKYGDADITLSTKFYNIDKKAFWEVDINYSCEGEKNTNKLYIVDHYLGDNSYYSTNEVTTLYRKNKDDIFYVVADLHTSTFYDTCPLITPKSLVNSIKDSMLEYLFLPLVKRYIAKCKVCGNMIVGNESVGRVIELEKPEWGIDDTTGETIIYTTHFNDKYYLKVPYSDWHVKTWYNRTEYEEKQKDIPDWKDFDTVWDESDKNSHLVGWRDPYGSIIEMKKHPVIGAYERVISKGLKDTINPATVECPCCKNLNELYKNSKVKHSRLGRILALSKSFLKC